MSGGFKLLYSPKYNIDIGNHVFPTVKYRLIYNRLSKEKLFEENDFITPCPAAEEELTLVHTKGYISKLFNGSLSSSEIAILELPYSKQLIEASRICVGATIQCIRYAIEDGISLHIGGGFHHAFPDHGEGFCVFNDVAVGIRKVQREGRIKKALVIDCDLHHGNGTAYIFTNDDDVFTFSIHQENNYPAIKPPSTIDIGLADGAGDEEYMDALKRHIPKVLKEFKPEVAVYLAGADPYKNDQLGGLSLTIKGLKQRDNFIFSLCKGNDIPVAVTLAGGYAHDVNDTVTIHYNTIKTAKELWGWDMG